MSDENHPDGYLRNARNAIGYRDAKVRRSDHGEIYRPDWGDDGLRRQASRCMDCGVPTCMAGCPIGNLIPDWNDLVARGDWKAALDHLHATNNFPEFTGYACPAPCEDACTLAFNLDAVTIKDVERAIVDRGWEAGWILPRPPTVRSGFRVAIVGSGPAGLACAQQLNRVGHQVTVYERDDAPGGLVRYGIPDFKFAKHRLDRRIGQLIAEGIEFRCSCALGSDVSLDRLREEYDAICLTVGAQHPRDVPVPGRSLDGIHFAMPYLVRENRRQAGRAFDAGPDASGRQVIVLGGGDTGSDCVATALRQRARSIIQINVNERPPWTRDRKNPWPAVARIYRSGYALQEGGEDLFSLDTIAFEDCNGDGHVDRLSAEPVRWARDSRGRRQARTVTGDRRTFPADLVLIATGFSRPETESLRAAGLACAADGTIRRDANLMTAVTGVFAGGDCAMGHSLLVWAIGEGRDLACSVDRYLTGHTRLPASLRTPHRPLPPKGRGSGFPEA